MEVEESLLQATAIDIVLEEYFPRPRLTMPPPLEAPGTSTQRLNPKQPAKDSVGKPKTGKRVSFKEDECNQCQEHAVGMTDEEIKTFLLTRSKRGRGSIGPRVEKKNTSPVSVTPYSSSSSSLTTSSDQESPRWERHGDGDCDGGGGLVGKRARPSVWSRLTVVEAWRNGACGTGKIDHRRSRN